MPGRKKHDTKQGCFTFSLDGCQYAVTLDREFAGAFECEKCSWGWWRGYSKEACCADQKAHYVAKRIIAQGMQAERACFCGEHYRAELSGTPGNGRLRVQREAEAYLTGIKRDLTVFLHLFVQLLICGVCWGFLLSDVTPWAQALFIGQNSALLRVLLVLYGFACTIALFWPERKKSNLIGFAVRALLPIGAVYTVGILWCHYMRAWLWFFIAVPVATIAAILWHRFWDTECTAWTYIRTMLGVFCAIFVVAMLYLQLSPVVIQPQTATGAEPDREQILLSHDEARSHLEYDDWMSLSKEKKLEYLQSIADYECVYTLGIEPVPVSAAVISDLSTLGQYNNATRSVTIQYDVLCCASPGKLLEVLLHEVRHAYQHCIVDMYVDMQAQGGIPAQYRSLAAVRMMESFYTEHRNYCDGNLDYEKYYNQVVEQDSREFALKRVREFYSSDLGR